MSNYEHSLTWKEIASQPQIWRDWASSLGTLSAEAKDWIAGRGFEKIWISGAGTSAFIGETLARGDHRLQPIPTTDFVGTPNDFLDAKGRILSVQFGRSGNSSETVGMLDILDTTRPDIDRLNITCNAGSELATRPAPGSGEQRTIVLPDTTHDQGFAMTSSYTTMLLTALACLSDFDVALLAELANEAENVIGQAENLPAPVPARAVFLGTGALTGTARECALKVLELTSGRTMTQWDSTLGYRHGPKAGVDSKTHVFVMLHPDPHVRRYDIDVATEIRSQFPGNRVTTIGPGGDIAITGTSDVRANSVLYVLLAQVLAVRWSAELGLNIDDPFNGLNLQRVVAGVTLYDLAS